MSKKSKKNIKYNRFCIDDVLDHIKKNRKELEKAWKEYYKK